MEKNRIKRILRESLGFPVREAEPKAAEGQPKTDNAKYEKDYSEVQSKLTSTMLKQSQVMAAAGLGAALIGGLIAKTTEDTIYQMQVDILIKERTKGSVLTQNSTVAGQASVRDGKKSGFVNSFGGDVRNTNATGQINSNIANDKTQYYEEERKEYKTVMLAEATKMNLTLQEATPILEKQISNQISGLF